MKKIVPVITLILAIATLILNIASLILICVSFTMPLLWIFFVTPTLVGLVTVIILTPFAFLFKKDILCKIAFFIDLVSLAVAVTSVILMYSA